VNRPSLETYSVSRLCGEIREFVSTAFPEVWVSGELQRLHPSRAGHQYFELVEKGEDDEIVGKLDAVIWRSDNRRIQSELASSGQELADGQEIRCRGRIDFFERGGRLQLIVSEVDPSFTLGRLELRRRETLEALQKGGLFELNQQLALAPLALDVALVTSENSAAYHDFLSTLEESDYGFRVVFLHASVQGASAERELVSALSAAARLDVDCIALVRGGGAKSDLAVFDSRAVAEAVARAERPVLAGLGHQIDQSVTDLVAHRSLKTPTKAAEFLVERVVLAEQKLNSTALSLRHHGLGHLRRGRQLLGRAERGLELVGVRLAVRRQRVEHLAAMIGRAGQATVARRERESRAVAWRLAAAAPRLLARRALQPDGLAVRLGPAAEKRLAAARAGLEAYRRLCDGLAPAGTLRRGFSITRDAAGRAIRSAAEVSPGAHITTTLADGELSSRVEKR